MVQYTRRTTRRKPRAPVSRHTRRQYGGAWDTTKSAMGYAVSPLVAAYNVGKYVATSRPVTYAAKGAYHGARLAGKGASLAGRIALSPIKLAGKIAEYTPVGFVPKIVGTAWKHKGTAARAAWRHKGKIAAALAGVALTAGYFDQPEVMQNASDRLARFAGSYWGGSPAAVGTLYAAREKSPLLNYLVSQGDKIYGAAAGTVQSTSNYAQATADVANRTWGAGKSLKTAYDMARQGNALRTLGELSRAGYHGALAGTGAARAGWHGLKAVGSGIRAAKEVGSPVYDATMKAYEYASPYVNQAAGWANQYAQPYYDPMLKSLYGGSGTSRPRRGPNGRLTVPKVTKSKRVF